MRRAPLALCALLLACAARAAAAPERDGYAFDYPRVLAQQRIFGIAHSIDLLAAACRKEPAGAAAQDAYAAWRTHQQAAIDAAQADLRRYYFGDGAADGRALVHTMRLRDTLEQRPASPEIKAACATLPQALSQPRYDLAGRFRLEELMARVIAAFEVEARNAYCRQEFSEAEQTVHAARYRLWREINAPLARQAEETLLRDWPGDAPAATYAEWRAALAKDVHVRGSRADCIDFSASLKRPASFLRNVFRMPPATAP